MSNTTATGKHATKKTLDSCPVSGDPGTGAAVATPAGDRLGEFGAVMLRPSSCVNRVYLVVDLIPALRGGCDRTPPSRRGASCTIAG